MGILLGCTKNRILIAVSAVFIVFQGRKGVKSMRNKVYPGSSGVIPDTIVHMRQRLQKLLRDSLGISRRKAEDYIKAGKVTINGEVAVIGSSADPEKDGIAVAGRKIKSGKSKEKIYVLFNKPSDYLTSRFDPHSKKTIYSILPKEFENLFSVGRLDKDTQGLLLLTNDGDLTYKLTHPKYEVEKEYYVIMEGKLESKEIFQIEKGLSLPELKTSNAKIKVLKIKQKETHLNIILHEGQNREVRRIFGYFKHRVTFLKRIRIQNLKLGKLEPGKWRYLTDKEVYSLQQSIAF